MLKEVLLPRLGQTMEEGTIEKWHKAEGDTVQKGEILYELTTDKATLEVESFADGVVKKILVPEGETVPVNELIALIGEEQDELPADLDAYREQVSASLPTQAPQAAGQGPSTGPAVEAAPTQQPPQAPPTRLAASPRARKLAEEQKVALAVLQGSGPGGRIVERDVQGYMDRLSKIRHTPAARALAYQAGVSLLSVQPSELGGRIAKADVLRAAEGAAAVAPAPQAGQRVPLSPMRQTIARRMTESKRTAPHFYLVGEIMMRKALERREQLNASGELSVTITDLLIRAAAVALRRHPAVNARFESNAVTLNSEVNVGVAVSVEEGLFVPVIRKADTKDLPQISSELKSLAKAAREGKLIPEQYEGGSITISNLGPLGVEYFLPIINPPEACILGVGRLVEQVVAQEGAIRIEPVIKVSLSADHRVIDGAEAARFYQSFRSLLEEPQDL